MKNYSIILILLLTVYLLTVLLTPYSLTGYYTDIFISIVLVLFNLSLVFRHNLETKALHRRIKGIAIGFAVFVLGLSAIHILNPFVWNVFDVKEFAEQRINDRQFRAYFKPVGAWGRGYGELWITESPRYLPMIERIVYKENSTDYNFEEVYFEGTPIDKIVTEIIQTKVMIKESYSDTTYPADLK